MEEVLENSTRLAGTGLQHARADADRSSSILLLEPLQLSPHLADCDVKAAMICINPALLRKWYKYVQRVSFSGSPTRSPVLDSIAYISLYRSCIFPGCHSVQGDSAASLFKFPSDDNVRKRWIDFVRRS